jgi:predicted enzyme related to lactoylglutathione lyase
MNRVVHFEIHADVPERAITFYSRLFGWKFTTWGGPVEYSMIETGPPTEPGIDGGLLPRRQPVDGQSVTAYICTIEVESLNHTMTTAQGLGATVVQPKMPIPGIGWLAYLKDTEGNTFGIMQADASAR